MKKNNPYSDIKQFGLIFMPINWLICLIVTLILKFLVSNEWAMGYLLGSVTSYLTFGLHMKAVSTFGNEKISPVRKAFSSYIIRFLISAVILFMAWYFEKFNLVATFIGLLVIKIVLIIFTIIREMSMKKNKLDLGSSEENKELSALEIKEKLDEYEGGMKEQND